MTSWRALLAGAVVVSALLAVASGAASATHDPDEVDFTVTPLGDRSPGATDVKYGQTVVGTAGVDLETLTKTVAIYDGGSWSGCGPTDASVFGIDRGNTHDGYETDEELTNNVKSFSAGEDRLETEYNGEDDFGASTYFDDGDEFVSVADCIDNPDAPGWYRITGRTKGVTAEGETVTYGGQSHYFWICDCEDEASARQRLGPPPSEPDATPTPARTRTGTGTDAGPTDATADTPDRSAAATPTGTGVARTPTPDSDDGGRGTTSTRSPADTDSETATDAPDAWSDVVYRTPTRRGGDGFGPIVALTALVVAALLVRTRA